jgi:hypothetical protein
MIRESVTNPYLIFFKTMNETYILTIRNLNFSNFISIQNISLQFDMIFYLCFKDFYNNIE